MEWRALEEHFRNANHDDPEPYGPDAVEWDYSRYARALGLTYRPGIDDLPRRGCVMFATSPPAWDDAAARYARLAEAGGWRFVRVSARGTVAVPDPVVYGLGAAVAGRESLIFARSGRQGVPRLGRRPRPPGCSIPLAPGERWNIAADRVRRRLRSEIVQRGMLVFVDDAHKLSPVALNTLSYLVRAHCAWQARMLSQDARFYLVLATTPPHEQRMRDVLHRFDIRGDIPVHRDRPIGSVESAPAVAEGRDGRFQLGAEDEHLLSALAAAPLALAREDVAAVFGSSAVPAAEKLADRGFLHRRTEDGVRCYVPDPKYLRDLPPAPDRVLEALLDRYRTRLKRGHQHLRVAMVLLAFRLGRPLHALAHLNRLDPASTAAVPLDASEEAHLSLALPERKASHLAATFAMYCNERDYPRARDAASTLSNRGFRSISDLHRTFERLLCLGRSHLDRGLPSTFWGSLQSAHVEGVFLDAMSVLGELFARMRLMTPRDILDRYEVAQRCRAHCASPQGPRHWRLERLLDQLTLRVAISLKGLFAPRLRLPHEGEPILESTSPAYVLATIAYAAASLPNLRTDAVTLCARIHELEFTRSTGNPADSRVQISALFGRLCMSTLGLLARSLADEQVLLLSPRSPQRFKHRVCRALVAMAGSRATLLSVNNTLVHHSRTQQALCSYVLEGAALVRGLLHAGNPSGAREALRMRLDGPAESPAALANLVQAKALVEMKQLRWESVEQSIGQAVNERGTLPQKFTDHLSLFARGAQCLAVGAVTDAANLFERSRMRLGERVDRSLWPLQREVLDYEVRLRKLARMVQAGADLGEIVYRLVAMRVRHVPVARRCRVAWLLDLLVVALESVAGRGCLTPGECVTMALWLREHVDEAASLHGESLSAMLARCAPRFFRALMLALQEQVGALLPSASPSRACAVALDMVARIWPFKDVPFIKKVEKELGASVLRFARGGSRRRAAKQHVATWEEDPTAYHRLVKLLEHKSGPVSIVGYGLFGRSTQPPQTMRVEGKIGVRGESGWQAQLVTRSDSSGEYCERDASGRRRRVDAPSVSELPACTEFLGSSAAAQQIQHLIAVAAKCDYPVLVLGETGLGKELVARSVHAKSEQRKKEMIVSDCGAFVESLLESELFGHQKGAFTGAQRNHKGIFERAHGSTLLLDELNSMGARMQASILRVLETGEYRPVGADSGRQSQFRVISTALPRLLEQVQSGEFRQDLFYRLNALRIDIPPLRERHEDAVEIAEWCATSLGLRLESEAQSAIAQYEWPGNVRQLRHCLQVAGLSARHGVITAQGLMSAIHSFRVRHTRRGEEIIGQTWDVVQRQLQGGAEFDAVTYASLAGMSRRSAQRHLSWLLKRGRVVRLGAGRATKYRARRHLWDEFR